MDPQLQHTTSLQDDQPPSAEDLAAQACQSCRKQKRKCDKRLPACGLCQRIGRPCDYSFDGAVNPLLPSPEDFAALRQQVEELQTLIRSSVLVNGVARDAGVQAHSLAGSTFVDGSYITTTSNGNGAGVNPFTPRSNSINTPDSGPLPGSSFGPSDFPALYFLDSHAFEHERYHIAWPYVKVPPGALTALGSSTELRAMIEHYFQSVHTYFPVISKIRLYQHLSSPLSDPGADTALLFLAMQLISKEVPEGIAPQTPLYQDVKSFYAYVEAQNRFSMHTMQALLLICLYEAGHAIYPAAYLSIGHAARLAYAEGLHDRTAPQMFARPSTWTEMEERRRAWWAVILLDRFIHIGNRGKPFATNDPSMDTFLPADDASWDCGQMLAAAPLALSASNTVPAAPFARTCQAGHLLGRVLRHLDDQQVPLDYKIEEAFQLSRTLSALADVLPSEAEADDPLTKPTLCTSMALCYSAMSTLYDSYVCSDRALEPGPESQITLHQTCIGGLQGVSEKIMLLAQRVQRFVETAGLDRVSPMVIDCFYQAAANYAWYLRETSDPVNRERITAIKELLVILNQRWRVAGAYLFLLADFWDNAAWQPQGSMR